MMYLIIIFISPLYFLIRKKWGGFILNSILYLLACATLIFGIGLIFWVLAVGHAGWHLRKEDMVEQAELVAKKMAEQQGKSNVE